ncbi:COG3179 Predicted chitinase [uncultured Caudovirales phage]|uniref:COG3179 Predicted chitinase n=1 Tax=uncultured Caudovirales phage TaxID=2100421 RepID=A0A6J5M447_9CAUD|nr:COG3179 Predicted chitinase [uncultured Caudovirales phage]
MRQRLIPLTPALVRALGNRTTDYEAFRARWETVLNTAAEHWGIHALVPKAAWLAQCAWESGAFGRLEESFNYSPEGLLRTWPRRFTPELANALGRRRGQAAKQEAIANLVYGRRMGNGPAEGWLYRGRGIIQLTGKDNYAAAQAATGLPLVDLPEMLTDPAEAAWVAGWYWSSRGLNHVATDRGIDAVSRAINRGSAEARTPALHEAERRRKYAAILPALEAATRE